MPCNNIVEQIRITLDDRKCFTSYRLIKQTCGQDVGGRSLLTKFLLGLSVDELLVINSDRLLAVCRPENDISRFLHLKHLFAIQAVLEVYTGCQIGAGNSPCAIVEIGNDRGEVVIDADIDVGLVTDRIKACGGCTGCGTSSPSFDV
jgi:hypothetical protein